jgi:hypothetical protein
MTQPSGPRPDVPGDSIFETQLRGYNRGRSMSMSRAAAGRPASWRSSSRGWPRRMSISISSLPPPVRPGRPRPRHARDEVTGGMVLVESRRDQRGNLAVTWRVA